MILDIAVIVVLLISGGIAFFRGFIREVLTITGVAGGLAGAYFGGPLLVPHMQKLLGVREGEEVSQLLGIVPYDLLGVVLSYCLIFIVIIVGLSFLSHMLAEAVKSMGLGAVDRSLGFIFGLIRGILVIGFLYMAPYVMTEKEARDAWIGESRTQLYVEQISSALLSLLPDDKVQDLQKSNEERAKDAASSARERLESINVLPDDDKKTDVNTDIDAENPTSRIYPEGYSEELRDQVDELIEEKIQNYNE